MAVTCCRRLIRRVQSTSDEPEPSAPTLLNDEYDSYPGDQSVMTGESALNDSYNILNLTTHEKPCCTTSNDVLDILAVLGVWITSLALCMLLRVESAVVAGLGVFILSTLCYLVPSMIYFRTGVSDDFKAIPLPIINVLPYRLLMMCVQIFALLFVATSFYVFIFFSFPGGKSIASFQYK